MDLWQYSTTTVLLGALLICVMLIINRLGVTNMMLKRIEEAIAKAGPATEGATAAAHGATAVGTSSVEAVAVATADPGALPPQSSFIDRRAGYLTVRDLKVLARATGADTAAMATADSEPAGFPANAALVEELAAATSEIREFLEAGDALNRAAVKEGEAVAVAATPDLCDVSDEPACAADTAAANETVSQNRTITCDRSRCVGDVDAELEQRRKRDATLIMNAQRRRRRVRGY